MTKTAEELYAQLAGGPPWESLTPEERAPWMEAANPAEPPPGPQESGQALQDRVELAMKNANPGYLWRSPDAPTG